MNKMKREDFTFKTPPVCLTKDCHAVACWLYDGEDGLCSDCYRILEEGDE